MNLLEVNHVYKTYENGAAVLQDINLTIGKKQCLGLVGESGCGKSTLARCILLMESIDRGSILFEGTPLHNKNERHVRPFRKNIQAVLQNPSAALNPKLKIVDSLIDPYLQLGRNAEMKHFHYTNKYDFAVQLLEAVELPADLANRYPHELSGGQKQRVTIARAISIEPAVIVLDEPTSSLDVLSQAAILRLLDELREKLGISYLFISHDLSAVYAMSQKIMVMRGGMMVDHFEKEELFASERHSYTQELVSMFD
jgi:peptide/nickel transport system ATP-binding protein